MTEKLMISKRDKSLVEYDGSKIVYAITKAMGEGNTGINLEMAEKIERDIFEEINNEYHQALFTVESIQDMIEDNLMKNGRYNTAKRFILYRADHEKKRNTKWDMSDLQHDIWSQKYEYENEGFQGFLDRVSGGDTKIKKLIRDKKFLFGGRILAGRGLNKYGIKTTYSNCYVLAPPKDNLESIFETAKEMARVFSYGGGVGISIENLRPNGSKVHNSAKETTGAVSFMDLYSMTTGLIGQKNRRGALMISIPSTHPDLEEFINIKSDLDRVTKANISVMLFDDFMQAVEDKTNYTLRFVVEDTGQVIEKTIDADKVFTMLAKLNYDYAEPGALWWDRVSSWHLLSEDKEFKHAGVNP